jgi:hypothetical protein
MRFTAYFVLPNHSRCLQKVQKAREAVFGKLEICSCTPVTRDPLMMQRAKLVVQLRYAHRTASTNQPNPGSTIDRTRCPCMNVTAAASRKMSMTTSKPALCCMAWLEFDIRQNSIFFDRVRVTPQ